MHTTLLIARLILAATFALAGVTKLADLVGTRAAVIGFGVPEALAMPFTILLPLAELAAAALVLASATARAGAVVALGLLTAFAAAIARSMARGEAPDCHCFGQLHSGPAGPKTLGRNVGLAAVAALVLVRGAGTSATEWIGQLSGTGIVALTGGVALLAVAVGAGSLILTLLRRHGELLLRIEALEDAVASHGIVVDPVGPLAEGLPLGAPAPGFQLPDLEGDPASLDRLLAADRPLMLLFTDPGCGPCSALMPRIATWQHDHSEALELVLVSRGDPESNLAHAREHGVQRVLLQRDREVSERYQVSGTPSAVLVGVDGMIASAVHGGAEAISALVSSVTAPAQLPIHRHEPTARRPAPDPMLRTLDGEERQLSTMLDGSTAVVFWNPSCGFCQRMLPELRQIEDEQPDGAPGLLLISTGDAESNLAMGLKAPIVLDETFAAGSAFGASGTPSAVLVDGERRIASELAVGAPAVLALAGASSSPEKIS
jgi:methylamine dehydrogenase accessory protein MauD